MDLPNTLRQLVGNPHLVAWRPNGTVIAVKRGGAIIKVFIPKPYRWIPLVDDICAGDWSYGAPEQLQKAIKEQLEAAQ